MKSFSYNLVLFMAMTGIYKAQPAYNSKMNPAEIKILIDSVSSVLNRAYVFPEKAPLYSKKINAAYKNGVYNKTKTRIELNNQILSDLQDAFKDIHLNMGYFPEQAKELEIKNQDSIDLIGRDARRTQAYSRNFYFIKKEHLPGGVFYLRWDGFDEFADEALVMFDTLFQQAAQSKVVIIDMRYNGGGNAELATRIESYFFKQRTALNHLITRSNDTIKRFTDPSGTSFKIENPVYILTSRRTVSAGKISPML